MDIKSDIRLLKGVGEKFNLYLKENEISTIADLFFTLPKKYECYQSKDINQIKENEKILFSGVLDSFTFTKFKLKNEMAILYIKNGIKLKCVFFNQSYLRYTLVKGLIVSVCGIYNPEKNEIIGSKIFFEKKDIYIDLKYKLCNLKDSQITKLINTAYLSTCPTFEETIPLFLINKYKLLNINDFIYKSHNPASLNDIKQIYRRSHYETYLNYVCSLKILEKNILKLPKTDRNINFTKIDEFINNLPFSLTLDQINAANDILKDINSNHIMNRLVEGDVGSGKTILSVIASYAVVLSNKQVCLMAPTEILAKQHFDAFEELLKKYQVKIALLTSSTKIAQKNNILKSLSTNHLDILITTQAILYTSNPFFDLGLLVIDEQHRFGVKQRSYLLEKYKDTDALYLTATPIPRTLGLSYIGDLKISEIHSKPAGRKKINTEIISYDELQDYKMLIDKEISSSHQIFVVVSKIDEDEIKYDLNEAESLFKELVPNSRIIKLNGRLKDSDKREIMDKFKNKEYDILISTTVIEVGVDIKDATMMFILDSDSFGLAQLHQLRGRVGRNELDSYCFFVTDKKNNPRLNVLKHTDDCFEISEEDFKLRGPGDYLGEEQSGFTNLEFNADNAIFKCACEDANILIENGDPFVKKIAKELQQKNLKLN